MNFGGMISGQKPAMGVEPTGSCVRDRRAATGATPARKSGRRESNPRFGHGKPACHHNTSPANILRSGRRDSNPRLLGSKPSRLPLTYAQVEEGKGVEPSDHLAAITRLAGGHLAPVQDGPSKTREAEGAGVEPARLLHSAAFGADAIAHWLALPYLRS